MEISGVAGWYVRNFMITEDVMGQTFRNQGVELNANLAKEGAGWIIITSEGSAVSELIEAGRRFERMALMVREMGIAIHPMTQILEEKQWRDQFASLHRPGVKPQFILRVGYLDSYPDPVSIRRPLEWFLRT
jgi:nitroreductase